MFDLVIRDALVIEGTRRPPRRASVAVSDGRIVPGLADLVRFDTASAGRGPKTGVFGLPGGAPCLATPALGQVADRAGPIAPGRLLRAFAA